MSVIRTPEERFVNLPGFAYAPHFVEIHDMRMHYVCEGEGQTILCLHGEPTWSYLYRKMIPPLADRHRVIAPDFIGFGRSDKFTLREEYTFEMHCEMLRGLIELLDLRDITLVCQDWGGLIGLRVATDLDERFARLVIMNTGLPTGDEPLPEAFIRWREFAASTPDLPIALIMRRTLVQGDQVEQAVIDAYEAPFPDASYKAGAAIFPMLVPARPDDPGAAELRRTREILSRWTKPVQVLFSDGDPITRGADRWFRKLIPGSREQPELVIAGASHFLQEDRGPEVAEQILAFIDRTPLG